MSIVACLSVPQPFVASLQICWSGNSRVARLLAEKLTPGPLSRIQDPHEGQIIFNATLSHEGQIRSDSRFKETPDSVPGSYPALGFACCIAFCYLEGGVYAHMNWHAHSNPLPSHSCPSDANERSGSCRCLL